MLQVKINLTDTSNTLKMLIMFDSNLEKYLVKK
jgi:hypothetical protein